MNSQELVNNRKLKNEFARNNETSEIENVIYRKEWKFEKMNFQEWMKIKNWKMHFQEWMKNWQLKNEFSGMHENRKFKDVVTSVCSGKVKMTLDGMNKNSKIDKWVPRNEWTSEIQGCCDISFALAMCCP